LPKFIILPFVFVTVAYWMIDLNNDPIKYLICCAGIILSANSAVAFGGLISAIAPSVNVALAIAGPILVPLMIFSGFFLNNDSVPDYFIWLQYLSWLGYTNEILVVNQWEGVDSIECGANATRCFNNGQDVIDSLKMKNVIIC
jgi:ABC-type multidrug transport system permease subunit